MEKILFHSIFKRGMDGLRTERESKMLLGKYLQSIEHSESRCVR